MRPSDAFKSPLRLFVGIALRAIGGQVEDGDLLLMQGEPLLDGLAMVDLEVIDDQQDLPRGVLDQPLEKAMGS